MVLSSELLASILEEVRPLLGQGKVADYIPALAQVPADRLGIAVCTVEGELFTAGDAFEPYSVTGDVDLIAIVRTREIERIADVVTGGINKVPGVTGTKTHLAFRAYSTHDLEAAFSLGE